MPSKPAASPLDVLRAIGAATAPALAVGLPLALLLAVAAPEARVGLWRAAFWLTVAAVLAPLRAVWAARRGPGSRARDHFRGAMATFGLAVLAATGHALWAGAGAGAALATATGLAGLAILAAALEWLDVRRLDAADGLEPLALGRAVGLGAAAAAGVPLALVSAVAALGVDGNASPAAQLGSAAAALIVAGVLVAELIRRIVADLAGRTRALVEHLEQTGGAVESVTGEQEQAIQSLTRSMNGVYGQVEGIHASAGELRAIVEESSRSIRELGAGGEELHNNASRLFGNVETVSASITQTLESVAEASRSTELLAQDLAETSASTEEIAASMRAVNADATETGRLSERVVGVAEAGREHVRQTIQGMEEIRSATHTVDEAIRRLASRAGEIGIMVNVIVDVAAETNLLAVNAAIIASQAGEHGSAFNVVAEEIRDLAERVGGKSKEITELIRSVQRETAHATLAIERGGRAVASGVELSAMAGRSLDEITGVSREAGQRTARIVRAVDEQTAATAHVAELLERVRSQATRIREAGRAQQHEGESVRERVAAMRDVAEQVDRTSEDHIQGVFLLSQQIERVQHAFESIQAAIREQAEGCSTAATVVWGVHERTREARQAVARLAGAARDLGVRSRVGGGAA